MYKLYYELDKPEVLNLTRISYTRNIHTQQYTHGSSNWREPVGYRWRDLELEGVCDELSVVFFNRLIYTPMDMIPLFYIKEEEENSYLKVMQSSIVKWNFSDSEYSPSENFSLTMSIRDIERLIFGTVDELNKEKPKNKPRQKRVIIPERQIVICRMS
jgi:hypothetical protein